MLFGKKKETLKVNGMSCAHCEKSVEEGVGEIAGVAKVKAHANTHTVEVFYKSDMPDMDVVKKKIVALGYEVA